MGTPTVGAGLAPSTLLGIANKSLPSLSLRAPPSRSPQRRPHATESVSRSPVRGNEVAQQDVLQVFLEDRRLNGDFISKVCDALWRRDGLVFDELDQISNQADAFKMEETAEGEGDNGFLKLIETKEWISGSGIAPINRKLDAQERLYLGERTKKLNILCYEALKRELFLVTVGIGVSCTGYCTLTLSVQAAVSYAVGVIFSCLYLQLLCFHSDNLSKKDVPAVFLQKSSKRIGVTSEDLKNLIERTVKGSAFALSSPRLVLPAALYGAWTFSNQFGNNFFDFQIVPAMFGFFAYKAAALVQVYRDNKDLRLVLPEDDFSNDN